MSFKSRINSVAEFQHELLLRIAVVELHLGGKGKLYAYSAKIFIVRPSSVIS